MSSVGYTAGMTTPAAARRTAEAYLAENRPWAALVGLLEDDTDYHIQEKAKPGLEYPLGPAALFISKATGEVWEDAWGNVIARVQDTMVPV